MVSILHGADRTTVAEAAKKHQVSDPTIYASGKHFGQLEVADVKRLKALARGGAWRVVNQRDAGDALRRLSGECLHVLGCIGQVFMRLVRRALHTAS